MSTTCNTRVLYTEYLSVHRFVYTFSTFWVSANIPLLLNVLYHRPCSTTATTVPPPPWYQPHHVTAGWYHCRHNITLPSGTFPSFLSLLCQLLYETPFMLNIFSIINSSRNSTLSCNCMKRDLYTGYFL